MTRGMIGRALLAALFTLSSVALADTPPATGGLGGKLFYTGGEIKVKVMPAEAGYTIELGLYKVADKNQRKLLIATNKETNKTVTISAQQMASFDIKPTEELVFGIFVQNTSTTYFMGDGNRNPDNIAHATLTVNAAKDAMVGFEDLFGGGDRDYDDNVFQFTGGIAGGPNPPPPANSPPDCTKAKPSVIELWPPNHKFVPVSIEGVKDKENDTFKIEIVSVFQDEPVKGAGSGKTSPDAEITATGVNLRAERSGKGDTRVYNISFIATDSKGAACPKTTVSVAVPHSQGQETPPQGPTTYDSTKK